MLIKYYVAGKACVTKSFLKKQALVPEAPPEHKTCESEVTAGTQARTKVLDPGACALTTRQVTLVYDRMGLKSNVNSGHEDRVVPVQAKPASGTLVHHARIFQLRK